MDERNALGNIRAALTAIAASGRIAADLVDMFAHVLLASMNEIALLIATADDPQLAMRQGAVAVNEYLKRLLPPPSRRPTTRVR
jgi:hypothetical protein